MATIRVNDQYAAIVLVRMANALNESDPAAARALLNDLARLHPE